MFGHGLCVAKGCESWHCAHCTSPVPAPHGHPGCWSQPDTIWVARWACMLLSLRLVLGHFSSFCTLSWI